MKKQTIERGKEEEARQIKGMENQYNTRRQGYLEDSKWEDTQTKRRLLLPTRWTLVRLRCIDPHVLL